MIEVTLKQGYNDIELEYDTIEIELEYDTIESVEELIKVVGTGSEINDLLVRIRLDMPGEGRTE